MERSETSVPSNSLNYSSVSQAHGDEEDEEEDSMQEEFERMKLDDSGLSTAMAGRGTKVNRIFLIAKVDCCKSAFFCKIVNLQFHTS